LRRIFQTLPPALRKRLRKDPANGKVAFLLAETRSLMGEWEKGARQLQLCHFSWVFKRFRLFGLGRSMEQLGSDEAAIPPLRHALALQPSLPKAHFLLGKAYRQIGHLDLAEREMKIFEEMQAGLTDEVTPLLTQGEGLRARANWFKPRNSLRNALEKYPGNSDILFNLGMVFFLQNDWPKAIENYRKSLLAKPNQVNSLYYMAQAYSISELDLKLARETIARAAELAPDNPDVLPEARRVSSLFQARRARRDFKWLQKARTLDPFLNESILTSV